jgi:DNA helicase MCM9
MVTRLFQNFNKKKNKSLQKNNHQENKQICMRKCGSNKFLPLENKKVCVDYQELRMQEQFKHISAGKLPQAMTVIIEGNFTNSFRPGDDITISGIIDYRYKKPVK